MQRATLTNREFAANLAIALLSLLVSGVLILWLFVLLLPGIDRHFAGVDRIGDVKALTLSGADFHLRLSAGGTYDGKRLLVTGLKRGEAVMVAQPQFRAGDYSFLRVKTENLHPGLKFYLFWQIKENPSGVYYAEVPLRRDGSGWFNLRRETVWKGTISKIEVGIFGDLRDQTFALESLEFHPYGIRGVLGTMFTEWLGFQKWNASSINAYLGADQDALVSPTVAMLVWLVTALVVAQVALFAIRRSAAGTPGTFWGGLRSRPLLSISLSLLWSFVTVLWLGNMLVQHAETRLIFGAKSTSEKKLSEPDSRYYQFAQELKGVLPPAENALAILVGPGKGSETHGHRVRYHLLPHIFAGVVKSASGNGISTAIGADTPILILSDSATTRAYIRQQLEARLGTQTRVLFQHREGVLIDRMQDSQRVGVPPGETR